MFLISQVVPLPNTVFFQKIIRMFVQTFLMFSSRYLYIYSNSFGDFGIVLIPLDEVCGKLI